MAKKAKSNKNNFWWREDSGNHSCSDFLMPGSVCPMCSQGVLNYDGLFLLTCARCGHIVSSGAFT